MGNCKFINQLNRLRKSSSDSIDNTEKFDDFKKYMHVTRTAELDLKEILRQVNNSGKKTLVLLCGSAGDGKSHLLSFLKNTDEEHLLTNYTIYNDATESTSPSKTAIETLNELLADFKDENLLLSGRNVILAINLGVLSNFIESEFGQEYSHLKTYVEESNILSVQVNNNDYDANSPFQHVSFSDYHMYSLKEDGVHTDYIDSLLNRIFDVNEGNDFYKSYASACASCPLAQKCPVKCNYEYLMNEDTRAFISTILVKTIIQDKYVLTTREILNFIYDAVVPQNFSYSKFQKILDEASYVKEFMRSVTPTLLFESTDVSTLMNLLQKYDPLQSRNEAADELAISYYVSSNIEEKMGNVLNGVPYDKVLCGHSVVEKINDDRLLKSMFFNLIVRLKNIMLKTESDNTYEGFLKDLYFFNAGKAKKLAALYGMLEKGVIQWCGNDVEGNLCLDDRHKDFLIYEGVEFTAKLDGIPSPLNSEELQRFIPSINVAVDNHNGGQISLDIDYSLYKLIYMLNQGYVQTADDRNNHADFISFVEKILQTGTLAERIFVVSEKGVRASIVYKNPFGFEFKVVK